MVEFSLFSPYSHLCLFVFSLTLHWTTESSCWIEYINSTGFFFLQTLFFFDFYTHTSALQPFHANLIQIECVSVAIFRHKYLHYAKKPVYQIITFKLVIGKSIRTTCALQRKPTQEQFFQPFSVQSIRMERHSNPTPFYRLKIEK